MTILPMPYPTDKWCEETLTPDEGYWQAMSGSIVLDSSVFAVGHKSVKIYSPSYNYYVGAVFELNRTINMHAYADATLLFLMACNSGMDGTGTIDLFDTAGRIASKTLSNNNIGVWQQQTPRVTVGLGGAGDFIASAGFDWNHVKAIRIAANQVSGQGGACWVDEFHLTFNVPDSTILIQSLPTSGKSGVITTSFLPDIFGMPASFITPSTITLPEGLNITIQMDVTNFDHWADDPTNNSPTRTLNVPVNDLALQAVYAIQANPLLVIDSFDQNMNAYSTASAVKIVHQGIPQVVNVPMAGRVLKGSYSFTAIDTATRKFNHWKKPGGTTITTPTITVDIQSDMRIEVHWEATVDGEPFSPLIIGGAAIFAIAGFVLLANWISKRF